MNATTTTIKLSIPWPLYGVSAVSLGLCLFLWVNQKFMAFPLNPLYFVIGASVLLSTKHKVAWTIGASWIVVALATILVFGFKSGFEFQAFYVKLSLIALSFSLVIQLVLLTLYFKSPFLNQRSNLLGTDSRIELGFEGFMSIKNDNLPVKISNISTTGLLVTTTPEVTSKLKSEQLKKVKISVPALNDFQTWAEVKRITDTSVGLRFTGWSPQSLMQHFKLVQHIRKINRPTASAQNGYSLVEMLVVVGLSSFVIFLSLSSLSQLDRATMQSQLDYQYAQLKNELSWTLRDPASWALTRNNPANDLLDCVNTNTVCDPADTGTIQIMNSQNQLVIDSANPNAGFSRAGIPCNTFDAVNGNDQCPIRFVAVPRFLCPGPCLNPTIEITLQAEFRPQSTNLSLNTTSGVVVVYKDPIINSIAETCTSIGGSLDANGFCRLDVFQASCTTPGEVLIGMNNGNPVCGSPYGAPQACPAGTFISGFDVNGLAQCVTVGGFGAPPTTTTVPAVTTTTLLVVTTTLPVVTTTVPAVTTTTASTTSTTTTSTTTTTTTITTTTTVPPTTTTVPPTTTTMPPTTTTFPFVTTTTMPVVTTTTTPPPPTTIPTTTTTTTVPLACYAIPMILNDGVGPPTSVGSTPGGNSLAECNIIRTQMFSDAICVSPIFCDPCQVVTCP